MKSLAIIPARSGSKGLPDKNIKQLYGKHMIAYTIEAAMESGRFDEIMVSTDSEIYAEIALEYGAKVPFLRSNNLSGDTASSWDVVKEVLLNYSKQNINFEYVTLLQPTSPLRTSEDINNGFETLKEKNANFVVSVCEMEHSPLWANVLPRDKSMEKFINSNVSSLPRQKIPTYYRLNGAFYLTKVEYLLGTDNLYSQNSFSFVMDKVNSIDIDDQFDFLIAETVLSNSLEIKHDKE